MKNSGFESQKNGRDENVKSGFQFQFRPDAKKKSAQKKGIWPLFAVALAFANHFAFAAETNSIPAASTNADLANLSIEQLMDIKVSILGPSESVSQTPAAVSVVTQDDIKRSGARNIPEALRLVPGLDVAQLDSSQWAVSARGFNDMLANKLLVLQDGRSIYTPVYSGVLWDEQGTMMEDIDHIEVVRGPGATLWGANAMNGVINIITKSAEDTQGLLVTSGGGNQDRGFEGARYGGKIGDNAYYRIYETYFNDNGNVLPDGGYANNSWQMGRAGFRVDWNASENNLITFQGDGYAGWINETFAVFTNAPPYSASVQDDMKVRGANTLARWTHTISDTADFKLQMYYDHDERDAAILHRQINTFDLNFQNQFALGDRDKVILGLDYRLAADSEENNPTVMFDPQSDALNFFSAFAQNEIAIVKNRLSLTLGSKFENDDYTGFVVEPGARLLWTPWRRQTFWASISRAVRMPSRAEETASLHVAGTPEIIQGNSNFESEDLIAYEIGYRVQPFDSFSFDLATFYNDYDDLRSQAPDPANPTVIDLSNDLYGDTYGAEATATWRATDWWRLQPTYTLLKMDLHAHADSSGYRDNVSVTRAEGASPQNQFSIRSSMDFPHGVSFDTALRYVDNLPTYQVASYFELDARLGWQITKHLEVALVGQNLLHDQHAEFGPSYIQVQNGNVTDIPRSIYAKVTWRF